MLFTYAGNGSHCFAHHCVLDRSIKDPLRSYRLALAFELIQIALKFVQELTKMPIKMRMLFH